MDHPADRDADGSDLTHLQRGYGRNHDVAEQDRHGAAPAPDAHHDRQHELDDVHPSGPAGHLAYRSAERRPVQRGGRTDPGQPESAQITAQFGDGSGPRGGAGTTQLCRRPDVRGGTIDPVELREHVERHRPNAQLGQHFGIDDRGPGSSRTDHAAHARFDVLDAGSDDRDQ
ncbi:Uncharacterised protein [Mycobacteroides abscessus subsp. massiliense]|nr:Uncharacterised protein [Mycobacteroides abscessus subsp. massiliense]